MLVKNKVIDKGFNVFAEFERAEAINQVKPYIIDFEASSKCAGSCAYCYASSTTAKDIYLPLEKIQEVLDDAWELGVKIISWGGGDHVLHPNWHETVRYARDKGLRQYLLTSGLISKKLAREFCDFGPALETIGIHIDTINPEAYSKVHTDPSTLEKKIQGYRNLLEAGYPPEQVLAVVTMTRPAIERIEETVDWFVDEMGCRSFCYVQFKSEGFANEHKDWEATLSDIKRALEYRAKKLGDFWLRIGSSDGSLFFCRTNIGILCDGGVVPCCVTRDLVVGNLYEERLKDIFEKHRDALLFNHEISGYCGGECPNTDVCFGCRANAFHYLGDVYASDPRCPFNPEARETYFH